MVDSKYSLKLKNNHKPENKCIDAKKCQFLFVMQYWRMNCGTLYGLQGETEPEHKVHCYKYKLTKSGSGGFLATQLQEQDLNSAIECLQEQELIKN